MNTHPALHLPTGPELLPSAPSCGGAPEPGARQTFEFLLGRHLDANPRQHTLTPADLAALMADLADLARTVLDPACGTGALLRAAATPAPTGPGARSVGRAADRPPGPDMSHLPRERHGPLRGRHGGRRCPPTVGPAVVRSRSPTTTPTTNAPVMRE
ncbi:hypothetical protein QF027_009212 [Streptomyces canus]|nr:hypothetical protein [Streptomyces canus]